jgi:hypothetical protein
MPLVSVSSARGAPGVSAWALILAAAWPHNADRVVVEADGSGGVISARYDLPVEPSVTELLSNVRRGRFQDGFNMDSTARLLRRPGPAEEALWVVPSPLSSHEAQGAWRTLAKPAADAMLGDSRLWIADCGRVWAGSPAEVLVASAPLNIIVSDQSIPSLIVLQSRIEAIPGRVALIVVGKTKHSVSELLAFTGADLVWRVPYFRSLAERAGQLASESKRGRRTKVWQTALSISHELSKELAAGPAQRRPWPADPATVSETAVR